MLYKYLSLLSDFVSLQNVIGHRIAGPRLRDNEFVDFDWRVPDRSDHTDVVVV